MRQSRLSLVVSWVAIGLVALGALAVATVAGDPPSPAERVRSLSAQFACPQCDGQSVRDSDAGISAEIRAEIARRVLAGESDDEVLGALVAAYGRENLLTPSATGTSSLIWAIPVAAGLLGAATVGFAVLRWRRPAVPGQRAVGAALAPSAQDPDAEPDEVGRRRVGRGRLALGAALAAVLAVGAGLGAARLAGDRSSGESITGDALPTIGQQLSRCMLLWSEAEPVEVLRCYDAVLEQDPANSEALSYRGWALVEFGFAEEGWPYLEEAVAVDPTYPDARAFRAVTLLNAWCRPDEALDELDAFEASSPLAELRELVEEWGVASEAERLIELRDADPEVAGPPEPVGAIGVDEYDQCSVLSAAGIFGEAPAE